MKHYVKILDPAFADAEVIYRWIAKRSPQGAWQWYKGFLAAVDSLAVDPERHPRAPEFQTSNRDIRELDFKTRRGRKYRMLFMAVGNQVHILSVRGFGQDDVTEADL